MNDRMMMKQYFDTLVSGIETKIAADPAEKTPRKLYALEIARLGSRLYSGKSGVAWCGIVAPFDLLSALGITSCFVEFIGAMLASTGIAGEYLEEAEHSGFTGDICGYHRSIMGAASKGIMPEPDCLIATTTPCSGGVAVMENLAKHFKKDLFVLNIPRQMSKPGVTYLAEQIRRMASFVAAHTGKALDEDRLKEAVIKTNEGDGSRRIENLRKLAKTYKVDGAINPCNWGCRQGSGTRGLISDGLKDIGVPVLNLEVDCVDVRNFFEGQLRTRLEAFVEMLG